MTGKWRHILLAAAIPGVCLSGFARQASEPLQAAPSDSEFENLIAAVRQYAEQYVSNLPNFLCLQVTQQFEAGKKAEHWRHGDTLASKLVFNQGREERTLQLVNDKPVRPGRKRWRTPLTTEGEFGILLGNIFGPASAATFRWNRWDVVRSRRVAVFDYAIDREHSTLRLSLSDLARAVVAYHGSVYADPVTGAVWRVTNSATDIPAEVQTKSISTRIDYDQIPIGGANYVLPLEATVSLATRFSNVKNEIQFTNYRKFEADSTITYGAGAGK